MKSVFVLALICFGIAGDAPSAMAQSPGAFTPTGNMTTARDGHTAALLSNGKVLIAGGVAKWSGPPNFEPTVVLAGAELYDPSTGVFTATGNMTAARFGPTAAVLADGRVLIAGGSGPAGSPGNLRALSSAELYDPSTGTFTATGDLVAPLTFSVATLLGNGKVLISAGGGNLLGPYEYRAQLYDPDTGTFSVAGDMTTPRFANTATLLADGTVLIYGGFITTVDFANAKCTELYDPSTGTFSPAGVSRCFVDEHTATLLTNGEVLIAGGEDCSPAFDTAELYDPPVRTVTATGKMLTARGWHTATLLPDATVLVAGGGDDHALASAELYSLATGTFSATGNMVTPRLLHTATLLPDGTVLIAGGTFIAPLSSAELYKPPFLKAAPVLFSLSGDGRGPGAILHADTHQVVSPSNLARAGEALEIYGTGLIDGSVIPPQVAIGGRMAEVLFFGNAPGFAGLNQVNARVPTGVIPGASVSVRLTYFARPSNEVTIGVR